MNGGTKTRSLLSKRERQILELIWDGLTNREIGVRLSISVKTVESHRASMMKKLKCGNAAQLLSAAIRSGLLRIPRVTAGISSRPAS